MAAGFVLPQLVQSTPSSAQDLPADESGGQCRIPAQLPTERLLRRLSLDLRGKVPSYEELQSVVGLAEVPESIIDAYIDSDAFRLRMRRYHEDLLWPRPRVALYNVNYIRYDSARGIYLNNYNAGRYRGAANVACQDVEQTQLQPNYQLGDEPYCEPQAGKNYCQEGWTWVHPYWGKKSCSADSDCDQLVQQGTAPGHCRQGRCEIKVCAFAAQTMETYDCTDPGVAKTDFMIPWCNRPDASNLTFHCGSRSGAGNPRCGAGPNLRWLHLHTNWQKTNPEPIGGPENLVLDALNEQLLRLVDDHTSGQRPYSQLLTTKRAHYNGVLMHWRKYLTPRLSASRPYNDYVPEDGLFPESMDWHSDWQVVERSGHHAGILTLPAYSLRFQTNRGRANRFRIAFMGRYFAPPDVDDSEGCEAVTDDLVNRCVCRKCHQVLEPMAAHFGAISERGSIMMSGFQKEFASEDACTFQSTFLGNLDTSHCKYLYRETPKSLDDATPVWRLNALEWADTAHPEIESNFDAGPVALAQKAIASGDLARATVKNLFRFFFGRDMDLSPDPGISERDILTTLSEEFQSHDNIKLLAKRLVTLPAYRRTP